MLEHGREIRWKQAMDESRNEPIRLRPTCNEVHTRAWRRWKGKEAWGSKGEAWGEQRKHGRTDDAKTMHLLSCPTHLALHHFRGFFFLERNHRKKRSLTFNHGVLPEIRPILSGLLPGRFYPPPPPPPPPRAREMDDFWLLLLPPAYRPLLSPDILSLHPRSFRFFPRWLHNSSRPSF